MRRIGVQRQGSAPRRQDRRRDGQAQPKVQATGPRPVPVRDRAQIRVPGPVVRNFQRRRRRTHELQQEIAERKRGEETLRESEARFATIFHSSPVAISLSSVTNGCFLDVNDRFLRLFGFTRAEWLEPTSSEADIWLRKADRERLIRAITWE